MSIFEVLMLLCFGAAWPFSIYRSYKARSTNGKSVMFLAVLICGYIFGILNKVLYRFDNVVYLYALNLVMISTDTVLWVRNRRLEQKEAGEAQTRA